MHLRPEDCLRGFTHVVGWAVVAPATDIAAIAAIHVLARVDRFYYSICMEAFKPRHIGQL